MAGDAGAPGETLRRLAAHWACDVTSAEMAHQLDRHDKLARFRSQFQLPKMKTLPGSKDKVAFLTKSRSTALTSIVVI